MSADITKAETWYGLGLGEIAKCGSEVGNIERVPGGWIYWFHGEAIFIPYSDEFKGGK